MKFGRFLLVLAIACPCSTPMLAQGQPDSSTAGATDSSVTSQDEKAATPKQMAAAQNRAPSTEATYKNSLGRPLLRNLALDQKAIWTSPSRLRLRDATWLVPLGGFTAALFATDSDVARHLSDSQNRLDTSRKLSDFGAASLVGAAGGLYFWGRAAQDEHKRETGLLSGEALIDSLAFGQAIKFSTGRERPRTDNARGSFGQRGTSFPSDHAIAAWSVASVIAHEYPGPLTKLLAYGLASAVSASRVTAKEHFPSDVLVGSTIGWFVGQHVYRAHHNPELGGGSWNTLSEASYAESPRKPGNMGSPYVPLDSWVYPALERLAALGYIHTDFLGMRPWTRLECARLVDEAADLFREEVGDPPEPTRLYSTLEKEFAPDLALTDGGRNRAARLESVYTRFTGISGKPLTDSYHFGQTIINDYGRPYAEGTNVLSGFSSEATAGHFAFYVRGEYQHAPSAPALSDQVRQTIASADVNPIQPATPFPTINQFELLDAYVAMNLENWQVSYGKQSLWWGPGEGGALVLSDNAEPMTMFRINRVAPFKLPGIFSWLGPIRMDGFFGQMDGHRFPARPFIHGQKISFKPTPNLELGFSRSVIIGGAGIPLTLHRFFRSFFSVGDNPNVRVTALTHIGDRAAGFDFSYRIPGLRKWLIVYADSFADDDPSPLASPRRAAMNPGIYLPRIPGVPKLDFRAEAVYTDVPSRGSIGGTFIYWDAFYRDSQTNKGNLIGSWVGREGQGIQAWSTYWLSPQNRIQAGYRHWRVDSDFIPHGGTVNDTSVRTDFWLRPRLSVSGFVQYELWKFPVLAAGRQANVTSSFQLTFWPRWQKN